MVWWLGLALAAPPDEEPLERRVLLEAQISARVDRIEAESDLGIWESLLAEGRATELALALERPLLSEILVLQTRVLGELAQASTVYGERHPEILALEARREQLEGQLQDTIGLVLEGERLQLKVLRAREATLARELAR